MCIWGNRCVTNKMGEMLYFPNWIKSGIVPINDLKVVNGRINDKYLFAELGNKSNYISEICQVKQGVHCLLSENVTCTPSLTIIQTKMFKTSNQLYKDLVSKRFLPPKSHVYFNSLFDMINFNYSGTYKIKVQQIPDKKFVNLISNY